MYGSIINAFSTQGYILQFLIADIYLNITWKAKNCIKVTN